ncbi:hypothetical protein MICAI_1200007 [Microcystis sp. T1-4]|nr:hypothetical protein MICAI_1200007 [Microcystis sp. T1-4]
MKIEEESRYFCTNINPIISVPIEVNLNWIGEGEVLNDSDIVINFAERTKSTSKFCHHTPPFPRADSFSESNSLVLLVSVWKRGLY